MTYSLAKDQIKILLLEGVSQKSVDAFHRAGYKNVELLKGALQQDELIKKLKDVKIVGIRSRSQLTEEVFNQNPHLIAVGCFCIGTNQVNLTAAEDAGVPVFNAPFSNTRSVAELVIGEIIMLMRGIPEKSKQAHSGGWLKSAINSYEVRGKTLGIIGYGHIGSQLSVLAESLGLKVIFYDIENKLPLGNAVNALSLNALLENADIVSLHVPETPATANLMSKENIAKIKPGSILINASRGTVVDIEALAAAIKSNKISGAAVDVFPIEPKSNQDTFESPLKGLPNVILTPHIGGSTQEAQENIGQEVAEKLVKYSDNGSTVSAVNFPQVSLPSHSGSCRILHIHVNQQGIMRQINRTFSESNINITGQYLQTTAKIGYVVMDIDATHDQANELLQQLKLIDGTIRARILY
ncbi:phosphoglycerate dehydrogenase [Francisellaceae bacterium]|nr:phosphoglycerate dehydrogenase [Francisellaceae bacterium]